VHRLSLSMQSRDSCGRNLDPHGPHPTVTATEEAKRGGSLLIQDQVRPLLALQRTSQTESRLGNSCGPLGGCLGRWTAVSL
jgi:hypothetical protein